MHIIGGRVTDMADSRVKFWYSMVLVRGVIHIIAVRFGNSLSQILIAFAKLRKATIYFLMSVCLSVHSFVPVEQFGSHWTDFCEVLYLSIFRKICGENASFIKI